MWQGILNKVFKVREKVAMNLNKEDEEKPFLDHLDDLRTMLVRMGMTLVGATIISFVFYKELFNILLYPMVLAGFAPDIEAARKLLINIDVAGPFMMAVNVSLIAAVIASFPLLLIFVLQFILPGLKANEKKLIFPAIAIGTGLFLGGACFAYWVVLPRALVFFSEFAASVGANQMWALNEYVTFTTRFILVFGIAFELPIIVMALVKLDFLNFRIMKSTWRHAIVAITLFAAIITPTPDVLTLMLMSGPLYVLYAICVTLAYFMEKKDKEAYPEYYAELEKDRQELEKDSGDEWDNENYNPWFSEDEKDEDDEYQKPRAVPSAPPPEIEKAPKTVSMDEPLDEGEDQGSVPGIDDDPEPESPPSPPKTEKSTEELAREDESRSGNPPL
ncbi:twin-arginine translocase subunit TatC [Prosthecobacter dejongeii]|uniref:Sec-independent protein translocase protein TatC n=1 Tax=Prosthecobacter dejongeii TaxID=48465 RepID=A0A7W7YJT2_9BACT|nr:twin-arginine translocase subunit TatC [Prosthecobacter dejongeii]MBB5037498.1 sec-independent protein translocase protein TatC [Prosthecobacter dejongeii]